MKNFRIISSSLPVFGKNNKLNYMTEEDCKTIDKMEKYGGSFVQALAVCLHRADPINYNKLRTVFDNYFNEYRDKFNN